MNSKILCEKEVVLLNQKYVVYIKEVATRIASGGKSISTTKKAYVKKIR